MNYHFGYRIGKRRGGHFLTRENYIDVSVRSSFYFKYDQYFLSNRIKHTIPKEWLIWYLKKTIDYIEENNNHNRFFFYSSSYHKSVLKELKNESNFIKEINKKKAWKESKEDITYKEYLQNQMTWFNNLIEKVDFEKDITGKTYTENWIKDYKEKALKNFDLNMEYLKHLPRDDFNKEVKQFLIKNSKFKKVSDLAKYTNTPGYYLLVVEKYKQVYIGTSMQIGKRIRSHWNKKKELDRLLFPQNNVDKSLISFDSYRALDITQIYIFETEETFIEEDKFIEDFNKMFVGNRISGGILTNLLEAIAGIKTRNLKG